MQPGNCPLHGQRSAPHGRNRRSRSRRRHVWDRDLRLWSWYVGCVL